MHYSAAEANLSIGGAIFVLPHLVLGSASLIAGISGRTFFRGMSGFSGRLIHMLFGFIFAGVALNSIVSGIFATHFCRNAERNGDFIVIKGPVELIDRFSKPGYGYAEFKIGNSSFKTHEFGLNCDCGFITPVGKLLRIKTGMTAIAKVADGHIIDLEIQGPPSSPARDGKTPHPSDAAVQMIQGKVK